MPEVPASWPALSVRGLRVGGQALAVSASQRSGTYRTVVSGARDLALTIGTVLPGGTTPRSVTVNGVPAHYRVVATSRGAAVEVQVPAPAGTEALAVRTTG